MTHEPGAWRAQTIIDAALHASMDRRMAADYSSWIGCGWMIIHRPHLDTGFDPHEAAHHCGIMAITHEALGNTCPQTA